MVEKTVERRFNNLWHLEGEAQCVTNFFRFLSINRC